MPQKPPAAPGPSSARAPSPPPHGTPRPGATPTPPPEATTATRKGRYYALLVVMIVTWSASFVVVDQVVDTVSPTSLATFRLGVGALLFWVTSRFLPRERPRRPPAREIRPMRRGSYLLVAGATGVGFFFPAQYAAVEAVGPAIPALLVCLLAPIIIVLLSTLIFRERLRRLTIAGIVCGALGAAAILTEGNPGNLTPANESFVGLMLALATPVMWAAYSLVTKKLQGHYDSFRVTAYANYIGFGILVALVLGTGEWRAWTWTMFTGEVVLAVLYLAVGCSLVGYLIWVVCLEHLESAKVGAFLYVEPFLTVLLAFVVTGDPVSAWALGGGGLVLVGVLLVARDRGPREIQEVRGQTE